MDYKWLQMGYKGDGTTNGYKWATKVMDYKWLQMGYKGDGLQMDYKADRLTND